MIEEARRDRQPGESGCDALFDSLSRQAPDPVLALIGAFREDPRPHKIDLGVGVYRDLADATPVLRAVKAAERRLVAEQPTKAYLGPEGDVRFFELLKPILFGAVGLGDRVSGIQTPGGTGALRLAAELIAKAQPAARVWIGEPTWPNHIPILQAARLELMRYRHFDVATQTLSFDAMIAALGSARRGDVVLLHGCCHNPTGADFTPAQWTRLAALIVERGLLPLIDLAYQGLGDGLDADAAGARIVIEAVGEALVAYSCDKNFGLYRERVGALYAIAPDAGRAGVIQSNLLALARANWSMPPAHGGAIVSTVLDDPALAADWHDELEAMRTRIIAVRMLVAGADGSLAAIAGQRGLFSMLPLSPDQVRRLKEEHAIYMTSSARINVAGLTPATIPRFVEAVAAVR